MVRRPVLLAVVAAGLAGGCATGRVGPFSSKSDVAADRPAPGIAAVVESHNQNAEKVTSLEATPAVTGKMGRFGGSLRGNLVFEKPRNFRFVATPTMSSKPEADFGSNDEEFWVWMNDRNPADRAVYVCRYDAETTGTAELPFQPEWVVEALGFRPISPAEERQIRVRPGDRPGTVVWVHNRTTSSGEPVQKATLLDARTGQVLRHEFYMPGGKTPVATVTPARFAQVDAGMPEARPS